jgi:hypothetical protein
MLTFDTRELHAARRPDIRAMGTCIRRPGSCCVLYLHPSFLSLHCQQWGSLLQCGYAEPLADETVADNRVHLTGLPGGIVLFPLSLYFGFFFFFGRGVPKVSVLVPGAQHERARLAVHKPQKYGVCCRGLRDMTTLGSLRLRRTSRTLAQILRGAMVYP